MRWDRLIKSCNQWFPLFMSDPRIHIIPKVGTDFYCHFASFRVTSSFPCPGSVHLVSSSALFVPLSPRHRLVRTEPSPSGEEGEGRGQDDEVKSRAWTVPSLHSTFLSVPFSALSRSALFVHGTSPAGRVEWEESDMNGEEPRNTLETERKFDGFYNRKIPKDI